MEYGIHQMYEYGVATPPHCRDREETGVIRPSAHVKVVGLQNRSDLNGCEAVITGNYSIEKERWPVRFETGESVFVRPANIRVLTVQPEHVPSAEFWLATNVPPGLQFAPKLPPIALPGMPQPPSAEEQRRVTREAALAMQVHAKSRNGTDADSAKDAPSPSCSFHPGDSVELHSLSSAEMNGTFGVCSGFNADSGRWEVAISVQQTPQQVQVQAEQLAEQQAQVEVERSVKAAAAADEIAQVTEAVSRFAVARAAAERAAVQASKKTIKVRAANLKLVTSTRCDATRELLACLRRKYPQRGLTFHEKISLQAREDGGVCLRANATIPAEELLVIVPEATAISNRAAPCKALKLPNACTMEKVLDAVSARFDELRATDGVARNLSRGFLCAADVQLGVLLMHVAFHPVDKMHQHMAASWPSTHAARATWPLFWPAERLTRMRGTYTARCIVRLQEEVTHIFNAVVEPSLHSADLGANLTKYFSTVDISLEDAFRFGISLVYSRARSTDATASSIRRLLPLVDAIIGQPGPHPAINVKVAQGKWPFVRTKGFDACNMTCTAVTAKRELHAGEELVLDLGEYATSAYVMRFGTVPHLWLGHRNQNDVIEVVIPAEDKPAATDSERLLAICDIFGYNEWGKSGIELPMADLEVVRASGIEPDSLVRFLQLCTLLVASESEVRTFCASRGADFHRSPDQAKLCEQVERAFEYNLTTLETRGDDGLESLDTEAVVTAVERQALEAWRDFLRAHLCAPII